MVIVTVDERDTDRRVGERARCIETSKSTAEDHDVWERSHVRDNT